VIYPAISFTPEGGLAVRLINRTGAASVRGQSVKPGVAAMGVVVCPADDEMTIGYIYDEGVSDGSPLRVVVAGVVHQLLEDGKGCAIADRLAASAVPGRVASAADAAAVETGHALETVKPGTNALVRSVLHFRRAP
jgi:hypothetical protein